MPNYMPAVKRQGHAHILPQAVSSELTKQFGTRCLVTAFTVFSRTSRQGSVTSRGPAAHPTGPHSLPRETEERLRSWDQGGDRTCLGLV